MLKDVNAYFKEKLSPDIREGVFFILKFLSAYYFWKIWIWFIGAESIPINDRFCPTLSTYWESFNNYIRLGYVLITKWVLEINGFEINIIGNHYGLTFVGLGGGVTIGNYCLAFNLIYLFNILILFTTLKSKYKIISLLQGNLLIVFFNFIRFYALSLISIYFPKHVDVFHDVFFNGFIFVLILYLYYQAINKPKKYHKG